MTCHMPYHSSCWWVVAVVLFQHVTSMQLHKQHTNRPPPPRLLPAFHTVSSKDWGESRGNKATFIHCIHTHTAKSSLFHYYLGFIPMLWPGLGTRDWCYLQLFYILSAPQLTLFVGQLNAIAPLVTMFFLVSYGVVNLACFAMKVASAPNFRCVDRGLRMNRGG